MADDKRTERASLGCGGFLLIIMALMFFFRPGMSDLEREVHSLRSEVGELKGAIDLQSTEIKMLQTQLESVNAKR